MKRKIYIVLCLILLLFPLPLKARAGGGGGGSGGGGGGGSSGGGSHTTHRGSGYHDPVGSLMSYVTVGSLAVLFPMIPMIVYRRRVKKKAKESEALLDQLDDMDPIWDEKHICNRVEEIYYHVQEAWTNSDIEGLKPYLTNHLYEQWKMRLNWMELRHEHNVLKNIKLLRSAVVGVQDYKDDEQDCCWLYIEGNMVDYTVDTETKLVVDGNKKKSSFVEYWKLQRIDQMFYLDDVKQKDEINPEDFIDYKE